MCGPPIALSMNGMVRNGPTPIITRMLAAIAWSRPRPRSRWIDSVVVEARVMTLRSDSRTLTAEHAESAGKTSRHAAIAITNARTQEHKGRKGHKRNVTHSQHVSHAAACGGAAHTERLKTQT